MDITHYGSNHFITLINCGLTHLVVWRLIARQDSSGVICQLSSIFFEWGAPKEILVDNDPTFCSQQVKQFLQEWGVWLWLRCAYIPLGNGIAERSHRSIMKIVARKQCTISEATYWYNIMLKDGASLATASANAIYRYWVQEKGIQALQLPDNEEKHGPYAVGDIVWIKTPGIWCTTKFKLGRVSGVVSHHSLEVNGVLCYLHPFRTQYHCPKVKPTAKIN